MNRTIASASAGEKWGLSVEREIHGACADDVWSILGKFGGLNSWARSVEVCELVAGRDAEPGCVRYLSGGGKRPDGSPERWVKEMLLEWHDAPVRSFTYCILDNSYGMQGYVATMTVVDHNTVEAHQSAAAGSRSRPGNDAGLTDSKKCVVRWKFNVDPVPHSSKENTLNFFSAIFYRMMSNLESALS